MTFRNVVCSFNADNQDTQNAYDGDGSPTTYGGNGLTFDPEARLARGGVGNSSLTAGYTGDGLRAWTLGIIRYGGGPHPHSVGGTNNIGISQVSKHYLYDGEAAVCELDDAGNVTAVNTFGADGLVSRCVGSFSTFYTFDPSGDVAQRLLGNGSLLSSDLYDGFGQGQSTGDADVFGYGGQWGCYTDGQTGLVLMTHRFYDPAAGRFLTRDPMGYAGDYLVLSVCAVATFTPDRRCR